ncbi:MFS transporter [Salmonirosea aquatica]|uniref:MFS transporter n=1 Tax=Salmonirosea aquatica TaxID=2654236 RepID=UPI00128C7303
MKPLNNYRWWVCALIATATAINYLDRQNLPIAIGEIRKTIEISDFEYGLINSLFLFAYGTMYAVGGRTIDLLGSKMGYAVMILWWSAANIIHGLVSSVTGLGLARFLLGLGEGGGFPASAKVVSEWFPQRERSIAFGIFNAGSSLGAVMAPPLLAAIISLANWRWTFILSGLLGLGWVVLWYRMYSLPSNSRYSSSAEKDYINNGQSSAGVGKPQPSWLSYFNNRDVWTVILVKIFPDSAWYFFIFWLPKYLNDVRGLDIVSIGLYAWIPYAFAGIGSLLGGWLSSFLLQRNVSLAVSRKIPLGLAAALLPASLLITSVSLPWAIVFFSMAMLGHQLYSTIAQTLVTDLFPSQAVGTVTGLMGCLVTYGAMLFSVLIGHVIGESGYGPAFIIAGMLHPLGFILVLLLLKKDKFVRNDLATI